MKLDFPTSQGYKGAIVLVECKFRIILTVKRFYGFIKD